MKAVLIMGSASDVVRAKGFDCREITAVVAINNAWRIRKDWSHCIYPEDFPESRRPRPVPGRLLIEYDSFVPANNAFGGVVYAGGTMAFTTGYWALHALKPDLMAFVGCDMIYDDSDHRTHFYGRGDADPLRDDPTLQSLEAKSERLRFMAFNRGCLCVNLSQKSRSRLSFDRMDARYLATGLDSAYRTGMAVLKRRLEEDVAAAAISAEEQAACFVESGDYWNADAPQDAHELANIDAIWTRVFRKRPAG